MDSSKALVLGDFRRPKRPLAHRGAEGAGLERLNHRRLLGRARRVDGVGVGPELRVGERGHVVVGVFAVHLAVGLGKGLRIGSVGRLGQEADKPRHALGFRGTTELGGPAWRRAEDVFRARR